MWLAVFGIAAFAQPAIGNAFLSGIEGAQSFYDDVFDAATFAVAVPAALRFSTGIVLLGWATATPCRDGPRYPLDCQVP